jgi:hypothetical protein
VKLPVFNNYQPQPTAQQPVYNQILLLFLFVLLMNELKPCCEIDEMEVVSCTFRFYAYSFRCHSSSNATQCMYCVDSIIYILYLASCFFAVFPGFSQPWFLCHYAQSLTWQVRSYYGCASLSAAASVGLISATRHSPACCNNTSVCSVSSQAGDHQ